MTSDFSRPGSASRSDSHACSTSGTAVKASMLEATLTLLLTHKVDVARFLGIVTAFALNFFQVFPSHALALSFGWIAVAVCGFPIFAETFSAIVKRRMTLELSMAIVIVAMLGSGQITTAEFIVTFVLINEALEHLTEGRARRSLSELMDKLPRCVALRQGDEFVSTDIKDVVIGDIVRIKPGETVPVDGQVVAGRSTVDESAYNGEPNPAEKTTGNPVFAGTVNQTGMIDVQVSQIGEATVFGKIVLAIQDSEKHRADVQNTADRLAAYIVFSAIAAAVLVWVSTGDIMRSISVVAAGGACGVAGGTPLAILGAIGRARRENIYIKGGLYLELIRQIDTVVFDKTGTLTVGRPRVIEVYPVAAETRLSVLCAAAIPEQFSEHPLAASIVAALKEEYALNPVTGEDFRYTPGRGVVCLDGGIRILVGSRAMFAEAGVTGIEKIPVRPGTTEVLVARERTLLGCIYAADELRPEAHQAIANLKARGLKIVLLSGDRVETVAEMAQQLGISEFKGAMSPGEKADYIARAQKQGSKLAMVGDGVNDAQALVTACVGVAVNDAADIATEAADVLLIGNSLSQLLVTLKIADRCWGVIRFNFIGTLGIDAIGMLLSAAGFLTPALAAMVHVGSELFFIVNSARLLPFFASRRQN